MRLQRGRKSLCCCNNIIPPRETWAEAEVHQKMKENEESEIILIFSKARERDDIGL